MILPSKYITLSHSVIGIGAELLKLIDKPQTITMLWEKAKKSSQVKTFKRFTLTLDFLYTIGLVDFCDGLLKRCEK
jgi:hypothetical protein